ncbi:MAG: SDR family oxidoreductase [Rhodospirillaceae bacterium]|jgi:3-oxoacyl-[acyl-carrier protein] reductase|nr:SDR family oxidoreductase [Rhodospirillaceae bacterium]MBT6136678.1 SDR family oxidoreductase [Rhodospirillaceae bacterium]
MTEWVLVTGGGRSIGGGICKRLKEEGYSVLVFDREDPDHDAVDDFTRVDLMDERHTAQALEGALSGGRKITRLVNNVGHVRPALLEDQTLEDFDDVMALNVRAAIQIGQALAPGMRESGFGRIVSISSRAALGKELRTAYAASKAALHGLTKTWALELAPAGVTVNCIGPGSIETPLWHRVNPADDPRTEQILKTIPVQRIGQPQDIANAVAFFLDARSGFVTGQVLYVCGGLTVGSARA